MAVMPMLPELGLVALVLALLVTLLQAVLPLAGAQRGKASWMAVARPAAFAQMLLVLVAYVVLTVAFVMQDFSVRYVAENSNSLLPRSEEHTSELQSLMRISYAVFCLKKKKENRNKQLKI